MIQVTRLHKAFGPTEAIKELSFTLKPGEVLGLLGPNGAGKTTAMRAIAGVLKPDAGQITIGGFDIQTQSPEAKRLLAYLPDSSVFFSHLTCWEHVQFISSVFEISDWKTKADILFERFQLADKKQCMANELSKGMKQRLGLICSFIHEPRYVLFDEPMNGLDPVGIRTLNDFILEEAAKGTAFALSSHLLSLLESICTNVLVIYKGESRLQGTIGEIRANMKQLNKEGSLEEIYLHATRGEEAA